MEIRIEAEQCTGCGGCVEACSAGAISLTNGIAVLNHTLCSQCQVCIDVCPAGAITTEADRLIVAQQPTAISNIPKARPILTNSQPWLASALTFAGREILPRLADALIVAVERRLAQSITTTAEPASTPSRRLTVQGRGQRKQVRYRGGRIGNRDHR